MADVFGTHRDSSAQLSLKKTFDSETICRSVYVAVQCTNISGMRQIFCQIYSWCSCNADQFWLHVLFTMSRSFV